MNDESRVELIQLGTEWCGPCRAAREYITSNFDVDLIRYKYISLDEVDKLDERYKHVIEELRPRSIPLFVVMNGDEIIYTFRGFNRTEIEKYADYAIRKSALQIKDSISQKEMERLNEIYNKLQLGNQDIEDIKGFESSSNGKVHFEADSEEFDEDVDFEFDEEDE